MRPRYVTPIAALLMMLSGCGESHESLEKAARKGRFDKIHEFVSTSLQKNICDSLVLHGIDLLLDSRNSESVGWDLIKEQATQCYPTPNGLRIRRMVAANHPGIIDSMFLHTLRLWVADSNYSALTAVAQGYCGLNTGRMRFVSSLADLSDSICELEDTRSLAKAYIPRLEREVSETQIEPIHSQSLTAYMIADVGLGQYEIALPELTYWGRVPSKTHAVLVATQTSFQSTGWFTIRAKRLDDSVVRLKEEFGSFNQSWPVYVEITDHDIAEYNQQTAQLQSKVDSLEWARETTITADARTGELKKNVEVVLACNCDTILAPAAATVSKPADVSSNMAGGPMSPRKPTTSGDCIEPLSAQSLSSGENKFLLQEDAVYVEQVVRLNSGRGKEGKASLRNINGLLNFTLTFSFRIDGIADELTVAWYPDDSTSRGVIVGFDEWGIRGECGFHRPWVYIADASKPGCNRIASVYNVVINDGERHEVKIRSEYGRVYLTLDERNTIEAQIAQDFDVGEILFHGWSGGEGASHWIRDVRYCPTRTKS